MIRAARRLLPVGLALLASPAAAQGKAGDIAALRALVDAQARQIEALSARLRALEARGGDAPSVATAAPPAPAAAPPPEVAAATPPQPAPASKVVGDASEVRWSGVPEIRSADGRFTFAPRLRVLADVSASGGSRFGPRNIAGTELRLVRLGADGGIGDFAYRTEIDFSGDEVRIRDAWFGYSGETRAGDLTVLAGNKLNDRSLDGATSLTSIPFAERNTVANLIAPQAGTYGLGLFASLEGERGHVSVNVKGEGQGSNDGTRNDSLILVGRGHLVPVRTRAGFLHLGAWGFHERINEELPFLVEGDVEGSNFNRNISVVPGIIPDPRFIDAFGLEAAGVYGRAWAAGEYGRRRIRTASAGAFAQSAWSLSGGLFLTGETPPLSASEGVWHRPSVLRPVTAGGAGAWALLLRYDEGDQRSAPFGGNGNFATLGVNWYLNDWAGFKLNTIYYRVDDPIGDFRGRDDGFTVVLRGEVVF